MSQTMQFLLLEHTNNFMLKVAKKALLQAHLSVRLRSRHNARV